MEDLSILGVETHFPTDKKTGKRGTNAADWWRTINPLTHLKKNTDWNIEIRKGIISDQAAENTFTREAILEWQQIGRAFDVVFYSYMTNPLFYSHLAVTQRRYSHTFGMDFDDNLLEQDLKNPTSLLSKLTDPEEDIKIKVILEDLPFICVTSDYLKKVYKDYLDSVGIEKPIFVIPNYIDLDVYQRPKTIKKNPDQIVIGFFGSLSHQADLYEKNFHKALNKIAKTYPQVRFEIIGNFTPNYLKGWGNFTQIAGDPDFFKWVKIWKEHVCKWDIGVAPLRDTPFNRSRSQIKWYELAAAKVPMVATDIGLYKSDLVMKAKTADQWFEYLKKYIEDAEYRNKMSEENYREVAGNWTIQLHWKVYKSMFEQIGA